MSTSRAVVSTRADWIEPPGRRIVTTALAETTCALVTIVSGAMKKPLPIDPLVSTRTTAGIDRLTRSSSDIGAAEPAGGAFAAAAAAAERDAASAAATRAAGSATSSATESGGSTTGGAGVRSTTGGVGAAGVGDDVAAAAARLCGTDDSPRVVIHITTPSTATPIETAPKRDDDFGSASAAPTDIWSTVSSFALIV